MDIPGLGPLRLCFWSISGLVALRSMWGDPGVGPPRTLPGPRSMQGVPRRGALGASFTPRVQYSPSRRLRLPSRAPCLVRGGQWYPSYRSRRTTGFAPSLAFAHSSLLCGGTVVALVLIETHHWFGAFDDFSKAFIRLLGSVSCPYDTQHNHSFIPCPSQIRS